MGISFDLGTQQVKALAAIRDLGRDNIGKIIEKFKKYKPKSFMPKIIEEEINNLLSGVGADTNAIVGELYNLYRLRRERELEPETIFEGLSNSIANAEGSLKWKKKEIDNWNNLKSQIVELLSLPSLEIAFKALVLISEYDNILRNTVVLTDIRPIYNEQATKVEGTFVTFALRLQYYDKNRKIERISLSLDMDDIKKMIKSGERAIKKAKTIKEFLVNNEKKPVVIMGEE